LTHPILILLILAVAIYCVYAFRQWKIGKSPAQIQKATSLWMIYFIIGIFIMLALSGRLHWLFVLLASVAGALFPLLKRGLPLLIRYLPFLARLYQQTRTTKSAQGPSQGQQSKVETAYVRMTLDHDSGDINGEVLQGPLRGKQLGDLSLQQILTLMTECQLNDIEAIPLLEAYLDRKHGSDWRNQNDEQESAQHEQAINGQMLEQEAYEILGLQPGASEQDIIEAHRRLMQKLHPDRGGSTYLAVKINQAKEVLLGK